MFVLWCQFFLNKKWCIFIIFNILSDKCTKKINADVFHQSAAAIYNSGLSHMTLHVSIRIKNLISDVWCVVFEKK